MIHFKFNKTIKADPEIYLIKWLTWYICTWIHVAVQDLKKIDISGRWMILCEKIFTSLITNKYPNVKLEVATFLQLHVEALLHMFEFYAFVYLRKHTPSRRCLVILYTDYDNIHRCFCFIWNTSSIRYLVISQLQSVYMKLLYTVFIQVIFLPCFNLAFLHLPNISPCLKFKLPKMVVF